MKYGLMLDKEELEYVNQVLNHSVDMESLENKKVALGILERIASLKSISTFKSKAYVTPDECFAEGIAGKCGSECKYYGFEGCEAEND